MLPGAVWMVRWTFIKTGLVRLGPFDHQSTDEHTKVKQRPLLVILCIILTYWLVWITLSTASVKVVPADRDVKWSIEGDNLGVSQNGNVFTAGTQSGTIVIRATDSGDKSSFKEVKLLLTKP